MSDKMKKVEIRDFCCKRDDLTIRGKAYIPEGEGKKKAIIISHGFGGNGAEMEIYSKEFSRYGYAVFSFDFCGGSRFGHSDGHMHDMTVRTECADLGAVIDYVKSLDYIDEGAISLVGASQGGFVSALTAAKRNRDVHKLALLYPALCIPDDARAGRLGGSRYDIKNVPEIIDCGHMEIPRRFHDEMASLDPYAEIVKFMGNVLIIHGTADTIVDCSYSVKAQEAYGANRCKLTKVKDAGHRFTAKQEERAAISILMFLSNNYEVLRMNTKALKVEKSVSGNVTTEATMFEGHCESPYFKGEIMPGAMDIVKYENGKPVATKFECAMEGVDFAGYSCIIRIMDRSENGVWSPKAETDSEALDFLNTTELIAVLEKEGNSVISRIFAKM